MYRDLSDNELSEIVKKHDNLTYHSKIRLQSELEKRSHTNWAKALSKAIQKTEKDIRELKYLKSLGFQIDWISDESFQITRTSRAVLTDFAGIVLGLVLFLFGMRSIIVFVSDIFSDTEIGVLSFTIAIGLGAAGIYGLRILMGGLNRVIELSGLKFFFDRGRVVLRKRTDLKFEELKGSSSDINLYDDGERLVMRYGEETIINANINDPIQKMTLEALFKKIKG